MKKKSQIDTFNPLSSQYSNLRDQLKSLLKNDSIILIFELKKSIKKIYFKIIRSDPGQQLYKLLLWNFASKGRKIKYFPPKRVTNFEITRWNDLNMGVAIVFIDETLHNSVHLRWSMKDVHMQIFKMTIDIRHIKRKICPNFFCWKFMLLVGINLNVR